MTCPDPIPDHSPDPTFDRRFFLCAGGLAGGAAALRLRARDATRGDLTASKPRVRFAQLPTPIEELDLPQFGGQSSYAAIVAARSW